MSNPVPEEIKRNVRAVLLSKVGGVHLNSFIKDYKSLVLEQFDYRGLGFETLQAFLKTIPEIARLEKSGSDIRVFGVGDPNTYLPVGARKAQGKLPKDYHKKLQADSEASSNPDMEQPVLEIDQFGWFSLCCPIEKAPSSDKDELESLFLQVGKTVKIHMSPRWLFVRYKSKEECLKALEVFGEDFGLRIPNKKPQSGSLLDESPKKKPDQKSGKKLNGFGLKTGRDKGKDSGYITDAESKGPKTGRDKGKDSGYMTDAESRPHHQKSKNKLNGPLSKNNPQQNGIKKQKEEDSLTSLYVHGITDDDAFRKLIEPYNPCRTKLVAYGQGWIGFLEMRTAEDAKTAIADLNHKQLGDKYIIVDYNTPKEKKSDKSKKDTNLTSTIEREDTQSLPKRNKKNSTTSETSSTPSDFSDMPPLEQIPSSGQNSNSQKSYQKSSKLASASISSDIPDLPPLVQEPSAVQSSNYYMDCTVFVGNFPANTTYVALQEKFSKYNVKDIIIGNTSVLEGCTRAFLYLSSINDVVQCVEEMNNSPMGGCHLKVDVPYKNEKMRFVLKKRLRLKMLY
ncbi:tudor domain-containing 7 protein [Elysia marginata]|uniref:Tudor domain-containing 7 protein n=1 Tax=Elysia marginata TaxID=1093978 RepID=A0AAV4HEJ9_9GAST|nr:tudor domain-containing 7 protein [Elysia marginata]